MRQGFPDLESYCMQYTELYAHTHTLVGPSKTETDIIMQN